MALPACVTDPACSALLLLEETEFGTTKKLRARLPDLFMACEAPKVTKGMRAGTQAGVQDPFFIQHMSAWAASVAATAYPPPP